MDDNDNDDDNDDDNDNDENPGEFHPTRSHHHCHTVPGHWAVDLQQSVLNSITIFIIILTLLALNNRH